MRWLLVSAFLFFSSVQAAPYTVAISDWTESDWADVPDSISLEPYGQDSFAAGGFTFGVENPYGADGPYPAPLPALLGDPYGDLTFGPVLTSIELTDGALFSLDELTVHPYASWDDYPLTVRLTGFLAGGGTLVRNLSFYFDECLQYCGPDLLTYTDFDSNWSGLAKIQLEVTGSHAYPFIPLENLAVTASSSVVPVPAAFWLFASAIALLIRNGRISGASQGP